MSNAARRKNTRFNGHVFHEDWYKYRENLTAFNQLHLPVQFDASFNAQFSVEQTGQCALAVIGIGLLVLIQCLVQLRQFEMRSTNDPGIGRIR